jgi:response regulator RpfG family c-di-GMP phosphodiesterase
MQVVSELIGERNYISSNRALRLQRYVRCLAQEAARMPLFKDEITPAYVAMLETWVPLMDVGHLLLPDYLLLKPAELSGDERELMQAHTTLGAELLTRIASKQPGQMGFFHMAITIARYHHERWDGSGYPDRLTGPEIPLPARVAALADVYDALRSQRVYRAAISHSAAVRAILDDSPGEFDPNLVQAFTRCEDLFEHVFRELPE